MEICLKVCEDFDVNSAEKLNKKHKTPKLSLTFVSYHTAFVKGSILMSSQSSFILRCLDKDLKRKHSLVLKCPSYPQLFPYPSFSPLSCSPL